MQLPSNSNNEMNKNKNESFEISSYGRSKKALPRRWYWGSPSRQRSVEWRRSTARDPTWCLRKFTVKDFRERRQWHSCNGCCSRCLSQFLFSSSNGCCFAYSCVLPLQSPLWKLTSAAAWWNRNSKAWVVTQKLLPQLHNSLPHFFFFTFFLWKA